MREKENAGSVGRAPALLRKQPNAQQAPLSARGIARGPLQSARGRAGPSPERCGGASSRIPSPAGSLTARGERHSTGGPSPPLTARGRSEEQPDSVRFRPPLSSRRQEDPTPRQVGAGRGTAGRHDTGRQQAPAGASRGSAPEHRPDGSLTARRATMSREPSPAPLPASGSLPTPRAGCTYREALSGPRLAPLTSAPPAQQQQQARQQLTPVPASQQHAPPLQQADAPSGGAGARSGLAQLRLVMAQARARLGQEEQQQAQEQLQGAMGALAALEQRRDEMARQVAGIKHLIAQAEAVRSKQQGEVERLTVAAAAISSQLNHMRQESSAAEQHAASDREALLKLVQSAAAMLGSQPLLAAVRQELSAVGAAPAAAAGKARDPAYGGLPSTAPAARGRAGSSPTRWHEPEGSPRSGGHLSDHSESCSDDDSDSSSCCTSSTEEVAELAARTGAQPSPPLQRPVQLPRLALAGLGVAAAETGAGAGGPATARLRGGGAQASPLPSARLTAPAPPQRQLLPRLPGVPAVLPAGRLAVADKPAVDPEALRQLGAVRLRLAERVARVDGLLKAAIAEQSVNLLAQA